MTERQERPAAARPFAGRTAWARNLQTPLRVFLRTETAVAAFLLAGGPLRNAYAALLKERVARGAPPIRLVFTDPGDVAVRPQRRRGHIQFLADVDDVVDPVCPARHRKPACLVEQYRGRLTEADRLVEPAVLDTIEGTPGSSRSAPDDPARPRVAACRPDARHRRQSAY